MPRLEHLYRTVTKKQTKEKNLYLNKVPQGLCVSELKKLDLNIKSKTQVIKNSLGQVSHSYD